MDFGGSLFQLLYEEPLIQENTSAYIGLFFLNRTAGTRQSHQLPVEEWREALELARVRAEDGWDAYFSPALLRERPPEGRRGAKDLYLGSKCLWVDLDPDDKKTKEDIQSQMIEFSPQPSVMVDSGNGIHAYWILDHFETDHGLIERRNYWLAEQLKADHCHSIDHLFRVPGTKNWKHQT